MDRNRLSIVGHSDSAELGLGPGVGETTVVFTGEPTHDAPFAVDVQLFDYDPTLLDRDELIASGRYSVWPDTNHDWTKDLFIDLPVPTSVDKGATFTLGLRDEDRRR